MMGGMGQMMGERMGRSNPWFRHRISLIFQNSANLGLDDQQKARLNEIHRKYAKVIIRQKAELKIAEMDLDALLMESEINMQKAKDILKKIEGIETEIGYQKIEALTEAKKVLTEEQRAKLAKIMEAAPVMEGGMGCMMCPMMGEGMTGAMMGQPAPASQKEGESGPAKDPHGH
jgi:Spy/CpxP family protein refolding chaperone